MPKTKYSPVLFYDKLPRTIANSVVETTKGEIIGIHGSKGSGKTFLYQALNLEFKRLQCLFLPLTLEQILTSHFLLRDFCYAIFKILVRPFKAEFQIIPFDMKQLKRLFKTKTVDLNDEASSDARQLLMQFLQICTKIVAVNKLNLVLLLDEVDELSLQNKLKVMQLLRYAKTYFPVVNIILLFNKPTWVDDITTMSWTDIKQECFTSTLNISESWRRYELNNKLVYRYICNLDLQNVNLVKKISDNLLSVAKFVTDFGLNYHKPKIMHPLVNELELINWFFDFIYLTNNDLFEKIMQQIVNFYLIKADERFVTLEYRNPKNKDIMNKLRSFVRFCDDHKYNFYDKNKFVTVAENIMFPYDFEFQLLLTSKYDHTRLKENNINHYAPLFLVFCQPKFWEQKKEEFWFQIDEAEIPLELRTFMLLIFENQIFAARNVTEKIVYYNTISDFIIFLAKNYLRGANYII